MMKAKLEILSVALGLTAPHAQADDRDSPISDGKGT
jgi:hypothetical protein